MINFDKIDDLSWMIRFDEQKIIKNKKKNGKKNFKQHKFKKIK